MPTYCCVLQIYSGSVLVRQGNRGEEKKYIFFFSLSALGGECVACPEEEIHLRNREMWLRGQKMNMRLLSLSGISLLSEYMNQNGA